LTGHISREKGQPVVISEFTNPSGEISYIAFVVASTANVPWAPRNWDGPLLHMTSLHLAQNVPNL
jgi:hypothetical protein